jgi:transcriptional regulator with GAF, ATPase, and Fis domain
LFFDEIGDLPLELQPRLLRVIQERQFERLGGAATIHTDVRVICATHRNLVEMVDNLEFSADLFYRVSVFPIELPPLLSGSLPEVTGPLKLSAAVTLEQVERSRILQTLKQTKCVIGGRNGAAARLGLPRTTLIAKMKRLDINGGQSSALPVRAAA